VLLNKQLPQLIKIISEPQAEAVYLVKMYIITTQKQSDNELQEIATYPKKEYYSNVLLINNVIRNQLMCEFDSYHDQ